MTDSMYFFRGDKWNWAHWLQDNQKGQIWVYYLHLDIVDTDLDPCLFSLKAHKWIEQNAKGKVFYHHMDPQPSWMAFERQSDMENFDTWYRERLKEDVDLHSTHLVLTKRDFLDDIETQGAIKIEAKVCKDVIWTFSREGGLPKETYEIWKWLEENCKGRVYYWDMTFYFENNYDAINFKMNFPESDSGENDDF